MSSGAITRELVLDKPHLNPAAAMFACMALLFPYLRVCSVAPQKKCGGGEQSIALTQSPTAHTDARKICRDELTIQSRRPPKLSEA